MDELRPGTLLSTPQIQVLLYSALCDFDHMCSTAGIPYWLDGGTLLGAYREQDLIAWDDDIDVCTEQRHLPSIVEASALLPDHLTIEVSATGSGPPARVLLNETFAAEKIADFGVKRSAKHLYIDIFTMQPAHRPVRHHLAAAAGKVARLAPISSDILASRLPMSPIRRATWRAVSRSPDPVLRLANRIARPPTSSDYLTYSYDLATPNCRVPKESFFPLGTSQLRGRPFPTPHNPTVYLRHMYGTTYMSPPPVTRRATHLQWAKWQPTSR